MLQTPPLKTKKQPQQGHWTYKDYLDLPNDNTRYEIIEGVLYMTNAPSFYHQFTVMKLVSQLEQFVAEHNSGIVLPAPFEVHLSKTTRPVQPDVLFVKANNWPGGDISFFEGSPDLIVEVISPSSVRRDRNIKFSAYEKAGVSEYWIADPKTRSVEVYTLSGGEYAWLGQFVEDEVLKSAVLDGLGIVTNTVFSQ